MSVKRLLLYSLFVHAYSTSVYFFFNDTAPTEIYTLSLHDALPISLDSRVRGNDAKRMAIGFAFANDRSEQSVLAEHRSEEHTSELQSLTNLVCRLLLEKKKNKQTKWYTEHGQLAPECTL